MAKIRRQMKEKGTENEISHRREMMKRQKGTGVEKVSTRDNDQGGETEKDVAGVIFVTEEKRLKLEQQQGETKTERRRQRKTLEG